MSEQILIKDGVKYGSWNYDNDEVTTFEPIVVEHITDIFGNDCKYFQKLGPYGLTNPP